MRVSIIIVNWNGLAHLPECMESLQRQSFREFEVILVDNGSKDDSLSFLKACHPWVRVVSLPENVGFAAGNNAALPLAQGEYIVTLITTPRPTPNSLANWSLWPTRTRKREWWRRASATACNPT